MIDDQLAVHPKPHSIISSGVEGISFVELRLDGSGPADRKIIGANGGIGRARAPAKIDDRIRPHQRW